jgi:hypothetical protein
MRLRFCRFDATLCGAEFLACRAQLQAIYWLGVQYF